MLPQSIPLASSQAQQSTTPSSTTHSIAPTLNSADPLFQDIAQDIKPSADTVIDEATGAETVIPTPEPSAPIAPLDPTDSTTTFIELRDMVQAGAIAYVADGSIKTLSKYTYEESAKKMLVEAWQPIIQQSGIKISPWFKILTAEAMCTGPLVALAFENRKFRIENQKLKAKLAAQESGLSYSEPIQGADIAPSNRRDNKNAWRIDESGFFEFKADGASTSRLKLSERRKRPILPADYEQLVKWNGKENVHRILNLPE